LGKIDNSKGDFEFNTVIDRASDMADFFYNMIDNNYGDDNVEAGDVIINEEICVNCGACIDECSEQAISCDNDSTVISKEVCNKCKKCLECCPVEAINVIIEDLPNY
jgi:heterodisulfide reductase subunit A-like polyferredoxin